MQDAHYVGILEASDELEAPLDAVPLSPRAEKPPRFGPVNLRQTTAAVNADTNQDPLHLTR